MSPEAGKRLAPGTKTPVAVTFDAEMDAKDGASADGVLEADGCDAKLSGAKWESNTTLAAELTIPKKPPKGVITLTLHSERARAPGEGDNQQLDGNQTPADTGVAPNRDDYVWTVPCANVFTFKMVYTGTLAYDFSRTNPQLPPFTESGSFDWTETRVLTITPTRLGSATRHTVTSMSATGSSVFQDVQATSSCTIQTPDGFSVEQQSTGAPFDGRPSASVSFDWTLGTLAYPGEPGVTGSPTARSGCTGSNTGFSESYGAPLPVSEVLRSVLDDAQEQVLIDANDGRIDLTLRQLPKTKKFDIDARNSVTEFETTRAGNLTLHATLTFTRVS